MVRKAALLVLCTVSLAAAGPSTQPSHRRGGPGAQGMGGPAGPGGPGGGGERTGPRFWENREGDWDKALEFFRENSPKRAEAFQNMAKDKQGKFRALIMGRYMSYRWMTRENPPVAQNMLRQMKVEDDIFGIMTALKKPELDPAEQQKQRETLKEKVREWIEARIEEREQRIEGLSKVLAQEKDKLQKDKEQKDQLVEKRFEEILNAENPDAAVGGGEPPRRRGDDRDGSREDRGPRPRPGGEKP